MLYGTSDVEPQTDIIVAQLAQELYNTNLLLLLIQVGEPLPYTTYFYTHVTDNIL